MAGQASQEKEQVFDEFCRIGNRQVTAHHQAGDARKTQPDDSTTVTDTLEECVAEERADHTARPMGQVRRAGSGVFNMKESGNDHQDNGQAHKAFGFRPADKAEGHRSEEHTSELQSPCNLVCRLLLEKKKKKRY